MKVTLILACAGTGTRAGFSKNKLLVKFNGRTTIERTLDKFISSGLIDVYIVVANENDIKELSSLLPKNVKIVRGGKTRSQSVINALNEIDGGIVLIHDGARPFVTNKIIGDCIKSAIANGNAITAIKNADTILNDFGKINYVGKEGYYLVQTPQAFKTEEIKKAYSLANGKAFNDDGEVYNEFIKSISIVEGDKKNIKLTYKEDFDVYNTENNLRIGVGFDCHRLVENRKLILGGINIPYEKGLLGHSDADVLTHAIMDAILSAISERDIGYHFPDSDMKYKDACSINLLKKVLKIAKDKGYKVNNVSAVIMAEKPKLLKYIPLITESLQKALNIDVNNIGIGATTLEGLGFVGREEGICVQATVSMIEE